MRRFYWSREKCWKHCILKVRLKYQKSDKICWLSPVKQKFTSPILHRPVTEFQSCTGNKLPLTVVKHILFCILGDVTCQLMALPPSQFRRNISTLALLRWAAKSFPLHFRENHWFSLNNLQKGFYCKKGSPSSTSPGIQFHIFNNGETMLRAVYSDCRPLQYELTLCHHKPVTTSYW